MRKVKSIHFVGIKGVGMTPLAIIAKEAGCSVTGSDIPEQFITDELLEKTHIQVHLGFAKENVQNPDLVITTGAHGGFENEEVMEAKRKGIPVISQGEAVGSFMEGSVFGRQFSGISVAGSHGKTTTTAIIATILKDGGMDPSYVIGTGVIPSLGLSGHLGKGEYFIAEADEYVTSLGQDSTAKLLWQHPRIAVFTNIEYDHPDVFENEQALQEIFLQFANQLPPDGVLIACGDDPGVACVIKAHVGRTVRYGFSPRNDFIIKHVHASDSYTFFTAESAGTSLGEFVIEASGEHNVLNSLASIIVGFEAGLSIEKIKKGLKAFSGTKRRSEFLGYGKEGALIFDDYAHHPTEIKKTLAAFRKRFPKSNIVCIFQPHMYSRTKKLFEQFIHSFKDADTVILTDIYPSLREKPDPTVSSRLLQEHMMPIQRDVIFLNSLGNVIEYVSKKAYRANSVVITMGAGDVYKAGERLIAKRI